MLPTNPLLNATTPAGPHLPVGLLRQYAAGTLAPAAQHRVEAHTLACARCADILEGLLQTPAATTDQAVAQLQQRLRQRVQQVAPTRQGPRLAPRPRWLSLQLAAAAALLLSLVAGGWWAWQQRRPHVSEVASATGSPSAAPRSAAVPTLPPTPAAAEEAPATPATAQQAPRLAHLGTRQRLPRRAAAPQASPATSSARVNSTRDTTVVAAAPAPPTASTPTVIASQPPTSAGDSTTFSLAQKTLDTRNFATAPAPARVRASSMPAAGGLAPAPAGGMAALREKLRREAAEFVPEAPERPLSGTVQLRLTIDATGKLQSISVLRGLRADYDEEAQRLVCEGPGWIPGISGGRRAALQVDIAVPF